MTKEVNPKSYNTDHLQKGLDCLLNVLTAKRTKRTQPYNADLTTFKMGIWGLEHFPMWSDKYNTNGRTLFTTPETTLQGIRSMAVFDFRKELGNLHIPTLILVGEDDIDAPVHFSQELHRYIPHSILHIVPGANHDLVIAKPLTVVHLIEEFLDR